MEMIARSDRIGKQRHKRLDNLHALLPHEASEYDRVKLLWHTVY
jgi:hypothetical protein